MARQPIGLRSRRRRQATARMLILSGTTLAIVLPLVWTLLASFGLTPDLTRRSPTLTWPPSAENYAEVVVAVPGFVQELGNSLLLATVATVLAVVVAFLASYALARLHFTGKRLLVQSFLVLATLPVIAYVIPLSETARYLHLRDTLVGVALANAAVYTPIALYVLYSYVAQVSLELEEAARLEGASLFRVLWQVVAPTAAPGLAATTLIVFVLNWNLLLVPLAIGVRLKTIPVAIIDFFTFEREVEWATAAAALIVSLVPVTTLVALAHRVLERFSLGSPTSEL